MVFPMSRRERESMWRTIPPTEVGEGGLSLCGPGGKANQEPSYLLMRDLGTGGFWSSSVLFSHSKSCHVLYKAS